MLQVLLNGGSARDKIQHLSETISHRIHGAAIYGAPWIPSIYPLYVSIYTSTMDPMGIEVFTRPSAPASCSFACHELSRCRWCRSNTKPKKRWTATGQGPLVVTCCNPNGSDRLLRIGESSNIHPINGHFRNLKWRYLPYIRPIFQAYVRKNIPRKSNCSSNFSLSSSRLELCPPTGSDTVGFTSFRGMIPRDSLPGSSS